MNNKEKILKWCGWAIGGSPDFINSKDITTHYYVNPAGNADNPPELSMNFFFKWVVPKLDHFSEVIVGQYENKYYCKIELNPDADDWQAYYSDYTDTPEQAWQEALLKLIKAE